MRHPDPEGLLQFPCDFIFKAFGPNGESGRFTQAVHEAVSRVTPVPLDALKVRPSSKGTYVCVSVLVRLQSFEQLRDIYAELRQVEGLNYLL